MWGREIKLNLTEWLNDPLALDKLINGPKPVSVHPGGKRKVTNSKLVSLIPVGTVSCAYCMPCIVWAVMLQGAHIPVEIFSLEY